MHLAHAPDVGGSYSAPTRGLDPRGDEKHLGEKRRLQILRARPIVPGDASRKTSKSFVVVVLIMVRLAASLAVLALPLLAQCDFLLTYFTYQDESSCGGAPADGGHGMVIVPTNGFNCGNLMSSKADQNDEAYATPDSKFFRVQVSICGETTLNFYGDGSSDQSLKGCE